MNLIVLIVTGRPRGEGERMLKANLALITGVNGDRRGAVGGDRRGASSKGARRRRETLEVQ
jgi:hypothetical protein